jgi:hypothetical protein
LKTVDDQKTNKPWYLEVFIVAYPWLFQKKHCTLSLLSRRGFQGENYLISTDLSLLGSWKGGRISEMEGSGVSLSEICPKIVLTGHL